MHTLLNKLAARHLLCTAEMNYNVKILSFAAQALQLVATLKSMSSHIKNSKMFMAPLNSPPDRFNSIISVLDNAQSVDDKISIEVV